MVTMADDPSMVYDTKSRNHKAYDPSNGMCAFARSLGDKLLEAQCLCLVAKASAENAAAPGNEALAIYQSLGLKEKARPQREGGEPLPPVFFLCVCPGFVAIEPSFYFGQIRI